MNFHTAFSEALVGISYAGRCPSWLEFEQGSPAERRAILSRWSEIQKAGFSDDWAAAVGRYGRALSLERKASLVEVEHESAQARWARGEEVIGPDTSEDQGL